MRELKGDWRDLFNGFMVALDLRKCFLALLGIFVTICACGGLTIVLGNSIDRRTVEPPKNLILHEWWHTQQVSWDVIYNGAYVIEPVAVSAAPSGAMMAPKSAPVTVSTPLLKRVKASAFVRIGYTVVFVLLFLTIWSYFGGAIARIAAYEIAKDGERIETRKALQFARRKFWSFFWAPLICIIGFFFFFVCNYAGGLVGSILDFAKIGAPLVALLLPLALLSGFIMTLICVGTVTGMPLFAPAVAAEGTDSFDAVSRGFSYVYSRPWHYIWYQVVSSVYGYVCIGFVILFAILMCHLGIEAGAQGFELSGVWKPGAFHKVANESWALILSKDHQPCGLYSWDPMDVLKTPHPYGRLQHLGNSIVGVNFEDRGVFEGKDTFASFLITFWLAITLGLALGYVVSFFISQQTMIYYILRKKVDGIEMNEVFEESEEEAKPAEVAKPAAAAPAPDAAKPAEPPKEEKK
ncbi:MAG TPA: hypothetical protein VE981_02810 [Planctomycetota bacterium]|nr:hypothetical protein [Planctomycetota bacterium]